MFKIIFVIAAVATGQPVGQFMPVTTYSTAFECKTSVAKTEAMLNAALGEHGLAAGGGICVPIGRSA